jgi:hypothetical protein
MSKENSVRIGGASGFWGDSSTAVPQLVERGNVQYLVFDYLAELTMSLLASARMKDPKLGYATDFVEQLRPSLADILRREIKLVSNAGGVNPAGCAAAVAAQAHELGLAPKIAVIEGDDVLPLIPELRAGGVREFETGQALPETIQTANAYLGAIPIKNALDAGADIVITGRCVDSAVTLGVLMHRFGWATDDFDRLAMGSLAGHIIECGCQATGGLHTDWMNVPDWANIGYPVVEVSADGSFVVTKPEATGGLVSTASIAEQILYEVGDPGRYILPDVVCDFTEVKLTQQGPQRVAVRGARGLPPTDTYKVCATYPDGFRATAQLTIVGFDAAAKARRTAEAILERTRRLFREKNWEDYTDTLIEVLGAETGYGPHTSRHPMREAVMRLAVSHADKRALALFAREVAPAGTSWSPGTTGVGGRADVTRILKQFSFLLDKTRVPVVVAIDSVKTPIAIPRGVPPAASSAAADASVPATDVTPGPKGGDDLVTVPLIDVAYARSGDKGDSCNVGVIARSPELMAWLRSELTVERVSDYLSHLVRGRISRFEVPGFNALNFVMGQALAGGGMASLRNDPWGKGMAQILLSMPIKVPRSCLAKIPGGDGRAAQGLHAVGS